MECLDPNEKWTIQMITDPRLGHPPVNEILFFCLSKESVEGGVVTGEVFDTEASTLPLSTVVGVCQPIVEDRFFMALNFNWGSVRIMLAGATFNDGLISHFSGRFSAWASLEFAASLLLKVSSGTAIEELLPGPSDGDTGTGTGQTT